MQARMKNPALVVPDAMNAFQAINTAIEKAGLPPKLGALVHLRISQINGCGVCLDMHKMFAKKVGETEERSMTVAGWRDVPYFTEPERAALALAECVTRLSDRPDAVPDAVWNEAARHFDEKAMGALLLSISMTNVWNRLNVSTRQVAGQTAWK
jgi:AhpD family alkylhydroperoxidase